MGYEIPSDHSSGPGHFLNSPRALDRFTTPELLAALRSRGVVMIDDFADWVNDRWDRDPRSRREKLALAGLGLSGEAGECSEPIKKWFYSGKPISRSHMVKELGDLLHYWVRVARELRIPISEIMRANIRKLEDRLPDGYAPVPSAIDQKFPRIEE